MLKARSGRKGKKSTISRGREGETEGVGEGRGGTVGSIGGCGRKGVEEGEKIHAGISVSIIVIIHLGLFPACPPFQGLIALYTAAP